MKLLSPEELSDYQRDGFLIVRNLFSEEEIGLLGQTARADNAMDKSSSSMDDGEGNAVRLALWNHPGDGIYGMFARCRKLVDRVEQILGDEAYHYHSKMVLKDANGREYWEFPCLAPRRLLVKTEEGSWGAYHQPEARAELLAYLDEQRGCLGDGALDAAVAAVRDGIKLSGLLVSVLRATPAAAPEDGAEREPEALAVLAAATVPLAALRCWWRADLLPVLSELLDAGLVTCRATSGQSAPWR